MSSNIQTARWINRGCYIIGNEDYGITLCRIEFSLELCDQISEEQLKSLAESVKNILVERLGLENDTRLRPHKQ